MSIKKRKFSLRLSLSLALKSLSNTKFLHKMMRPLNTALSGDVWPRGDTITYVCGFTLKTGPAVWLLGTGKNHFYNTSVGHSLYSIRSKDWHCSHYFNHIDQPLHVCQCGGKRSPHFIAPQYNHRNHRKPKEMTQRLDRVYLEDRITIVNW